MSNKAAWKKFESSMKEKRTGNRGKDVVKNERLTVQRLSAEVSGAAQKYSRMGPREFVPYEFEELTLENVKEACLQHFGSVMEEEMEAMECDVVAGEQGPSCTSIDQLPHPTKVIHVRFIEASLAGEKLTKKRKDKKHTKKTLPVSPVAKRVKVVGSQEQGSSQVTRYPKSLSVLDMLKLGKVIDDKYELIELDTFNLTDMKWCNKPVSVEFAIDKNPLGTGAFRMAFKATSKTPGFEGKPWVVKKYLKQTIDTIKQLKQDVEQQTRKVVQMHMLAQNMCLKLKQELNKESILDLYGQTLMYNKIYMGRLTSELGDCQWVTVEDYIEGEFTKYINNDGELCGDNTVIRQKCESLAHFSYERSSRELIVVDMQGSGYNLYDPEIASTTLVKDGEVLFTAGNLSKQAINNFLNSHVKCNDYCDFLGLKQPSKSQTS
ncbi:myosin heavy chain kinase D-like [Actinia tenebrosa]|uniref:Myosin heavy chain kinase D-like n=1 Tax=Actinia tenebrosa TaxID=6105 RepID=A0A6P8HKF2_ACTTE|nr:myosin heavy chain kinase D-like [Actinia tenebrosa]